MAVDYILTLTQGDIYSTYDIYYDAISISNLALLSTGGTATNIPLSLLLSGITITIPDTATQIIVESNGFCQNYLYIPITPYVPPDPIPNLCLKYTILSVDGPTTYNWTYVPNGVLSGKTLWEYEDISNSQTYQISWNPNASQWEMEYDSTTVFILSSNSVTPLGSWQSTNRRFTDISTFTGNCEPITLPVIQNLDVVNNQCKATQPCTGKIIVTATGGVPPYQYALSYSPGDPTNVNWQTSNIIQGLCESNVNVVVKDSNGNLSQPQQAIISFNEVAKTYTATLEQMSYQQTINTQQPQRKVAAQSSWLFKLDQNLDPGVILNLKITLTGEILVYPPNTDYNYIFTMTPKKNGQLLLPTQQTSITTTNPNNICPALNDTGLTFTDTYNLTYQNGDSLIIETSATLTINTVEILLNGCFSALENVIRVSLEPSASPSATGCQCCTVVYEKGKNIFSLSTR